MSESVDGKNLGMAGLSRERETTLGSGSRETQGTQRPGTDEAFPKRDGLRGGRPARSGD